MRAGGDGNGPGAAPVVAAANWAALMRAYANMLLRMLTTAVFCDTLAEDFLSVDVLETRTGLSYLTSDWLGGIMLGRLRESE